MNDQTRKITISRLKRLHNKLVDIIYWADYPTHLTVGALIDCKETMTYLGGGIDTREGLVFERLGKSWVIIYETGLEKDNCIHVWNEEKESEKLIFYTEEQFQEWKS